MNIFTDGATSNNGRTGAVGGWAFIAVDFLSDPNASVFSAAAHVDDTTNNQCELMAVINACKWAKEYYPNEPHVIMTDSAYIANCYTQNWYKKWQGNGWINSVRQPVANKELWQQLIPFFEDYNFDFWWMRGHNSTRDATLAYWNDRVDKMAVNAKFNLGDGLNG